MFVYCMYNVLFINDDNLTPKILKSVYENNDLSLVLLR